MNDDFRKKAKRLKKSFRQGVMSLGELRRQLWITYVEMFKKQPRRKAV